MYILKIQGVSAPPLPQRAGAHVYIHNACNLEILHVRSLSIFNSLTEINRPSDGFTRHLVRLLDFFLV